MNKHSLRRHVKIHPLTRVPFIQSTRVRHAPDTVNHRLDININANCTNQRDRDRSAPPTRPASPPVTLCQRRFCRRRRYFVGRHIVIRATRGLRPGDVIAENYGPIFTKRSLAERQRTLAARYWFRCTCDACQKDWPRFENLTNDSARLR